MQTQDSSASNATAQGAATTAPDTSPEWPLYVQGRARQRRAGLFAAVTLVLALATLVDGALSHMRGGGSYRLEMLAGTSQPVSGPMGSGDFESRVVAFPIPRDAPISFDFEGFFTSYWFGTGMWRGTVHVGETAPSGTYALAVGVEGQPSSTFQTYTLSVARTRDEQDRNSLSFVRRWSGWNPFWVAAVFAALGFGTGIGSFALGRRLTGLLRDLGLAEVVRVHPDGEGVALVCVTGKRPVEGRSFVSYDADMRRLGKVLVREEKNGLTTCLFLGDGDGDGPLPGSGSFVAFWPRKEPASTPVRRGPLTPVVEKALGVKRPGSGDGDGRDGSGRDGSGVA